MTCSISTGTDFTANAVINATGTWETPIFPTITAWNISPEARWHTKAFRDVEDFRDQRVLVVGGGASAINFDDVGKVTDHRGFRAHCALEPGTLQP